MANNHYACYAFPQRVYDRYQEQIEALFEEHGGQDMDTIEEGGVVRFCCPLCTDSESIDDALSDDDAPWALDPCFSAHAIFSDGVDFDDHQMIVVGQKTFTMNGNDPENPQVSFTLDPDRRLDIERASRQWMRAYAAFRYYCGKGRILTEAQRHTAGGRADQCPRCNSSNVDGEGVDIRGDHAVQECVCCECGCTWRDVYMLIGAGVDPKET